MNRAKIARTANSIGFGDPKLTATSRSSTLHRWLEANVDGWDRDYEGGYTLDELWAEVASVVEATNPPAHVRTQMRARNRFDIPGWSVGYNDEISAHAATRSPGRYLLFVMTSDDREPRSLDEEVTVGLYQFEDDAWEQIGYHDFPSVSAVLRMTDAQLRRVLEQD